MTEISIWFDGGSRNNQSKESRQGYGSFLTLHNGKLVTMTIDRGTKDERRASQCNLDLGKATNNEAESTNITVKGMIAMNFPVTPDMKNNGANTAMVVIVPEIKGQLNSFKVTIADSFFV